MDIARYHKVQIGNHALQPESLMLGYGYDPALSDRFSMTTCWPRRSDSH